MAAPNLLLIMLLLRCAEQPPASPYPMACLKQLLDWFRRRPRLISLYLGAAVSSVLIVQTIGAWAPSVLHREQGLAPAAAALAFGVALLAASPLGHLSAGFLVDLREKWVPPSMVMAGGLLLAVPLLWMLPGATSSVTACSLMALTSLVGGMAAVAALAGLPPMLPMALRDAGVRMFLVFITVLGVGLGPFIAGVVSDGIGTGVHGLSTALYLVCVAAAILGAGSALLASKGWRRAALENAR